MDSTQYRLECIIFRWNKPLPAVFLIDDNRKSRPTAVYERGSYRSLDNKKGTRPRPIKALAYNFTRIEDEKGNPIITSRAVDKQTAEEFAKRLLAKAVPISRQEYLDELAKIIWRRPNIDTLEYMNLYESPGAYRVFDEDLGGESRGDLPAYVCQDRIIEAPGDEANSSMTDRFASRQQRLENRLSLERELSSETGEAEQVDARRKKKEIVNDLMDLITDMEADDLEQLLKHARLLKQED